MKKKNPISIRIFLEENHQVFLFFFTHTCLCFQFSECFLFVIGFILWQWLTCFHGFFHYFHSVFFLLKRLCLKEKVHTNIYKSIHEFHIKDLETFYINSWYDIIFDLLPELILRLSEWVMFAIDIIKIQLPIVIYQLQH